MSTGYFYKPCLLVLTSIMTLATTGCPFFVSTNSPAPPQGKYIATVAEQVLPSNGTILSKIPIPRQPIAGIYRFDLAGQTPNGTATSFGSASGQPYTTLTGGDGRIFVTNMRQNAEWYIRWNWTNGCQTNAQSQPRLPNYAYYQVDTPIEQNGNVPYEIQCVSYQGSTQSLYNSASPQFSLNSSPPSSLTETAGVQLTAGSGQPTLYVYGADDASSANTVYSAAASSISGNGLTATFPYPRNGANPLAPGIYGTAIVNHNPDGTETYAGATGSFTIGDNNTSFPQAFGVAAGMNSTIKDVCYLLTGSCNTSSSESHFPIVSLYGQSQVRWGTHTISVGVHPTAVIAFGTSSNDVYTQNAKVSTDTQTTGTSKILVVNTGSNSVSIVDVLNAALLHTTLVGTSPVAAVISADLTKAYVANYGSNNLSVIDLSSYAIVGTIPTMVNPTSIDIDQIGNLWVGGAGYVNQINPATSSTISSTAVAGTITSLAVSRSLNQVVTTTWTAGTGIQLTASNTGTHTLAMSQSVGSSQPYSASSLASQLALPPQLGSGTLVSANYGNALSVSATPTGFLVTDLTTGSPILSGTTPGPVRSLAVDPNYGSVYMTVADTNSVITVPLPPIPTNQASY